MASLAGPEPSSDAVWISVGVVRGGVGPILKDGYTDYMCMCVCMYGMAPIKIDHFLSSYCTQYYLRGTIQEVLVCGTY